MKIGVIKESSAGETRVAGTPATVAQLVKLGYEVVVESGAGVASSFTDEAYVEAGAATGTHAEAWGADVVLKVNAPTSDEIGLLADGATLVSLIAPALNEALVDELAQRNLTVLAMDAVPRISRAQSMDVLSSMANIAGYRAVVEAAHEFGRFFTGQVTAAGKVPPALNEALVDELAQRNLTVLAMDAVPRISRAQSMDVLSSMANIAGYRAVVEAAHEFGRFFTGQVTAAGKVPPAKVLVAGAGVAGLAAIGAASSLGAIVRATDPRPEVADQVKSIGGEYLKVDVEQEVSTDGYAKATSEDYDRRAAEIYSEQAADVDIIITTALIPGRAAPRLITEADVAAMKPGSVIVDMAAAQGGNVAGSVAGEKVVTDNGVTILGYTDLAGRLPTQASQLYGQNLVNLLKLVTPGKDGELTLDFDDVVQRGVTVVRDGEKTWPPPPVNVSAAPAAAPAVAEAKKAEEKPPPNPAVKWAVMGAGVLALFLITAFAPGELPKHFTVLMLSVVIGFYVIGNVAHALHTPLMSVTNAISGIIVVGAMLQIGGSTYGDNGTVIGVLSFVAILVASINVFGGFAVTRRMLSMFSK